MGLIKANYRVNTFSSLMILLILTGCNGPAAPQLYNGQIDSLSDIWVPDTREGLCNVEMILTDGKMVLKGLTTIPEAKSAIVSFLASKNVKFLDNLRVIPDTNEVREPWGLINVSVCNIRRNRSHDAEMVTQALMGTPVKILTEDDGWYQIQTPDSYIGWIDSEAVITLPVNKFNQWRRSERIVYLGKTADIYSAINENGVVSDVVAGAILQKKGEESGYYRVILPDGREGLLQKRDCMEFSRWATESRPEADKILKTASRFMGTPYLWGGTSVKGMDCSGFIKTVYFLNGLILARDASLQSKHGYQIKDFRNMESLKPGDLLFFGQKAGENPKPSHVGMYIGNTEFIHESGMVKINSLDSTRKNFSRYRHDSFLGARRIIGQGPGPGLQTVSGNPWYF